MLAEHCARVSCAHRKDMHASGGGYCSVCSCQSFAVTVGLHDNDEIVTSGNGGKQSRLNYSFELIEPDFLLRMAAVLYTGKQKYGAKNWQLLTDPQEHIGRAMYHLTQALANKDHSEDHLANACCRIMFAQWAQRYHSDRMIPTNFGAYSAGEQPIEYGKPIEWGKFFARPDGVTVPMDKWCQTCEHDKDAHLITPNIEGDVLVCAKCECRQQVIKDEDSWCATCKHRMSQHALIGAAQYWICQQCNCSLLVAKSDLSIEAKLGQDTESHDHPYAQPQPVDGPQEVE